MYHSSGRRSGRGPRYSRSSALVRLPAKQERITLVARAKSAAIIVHHEREPTPTPWHSSIRVNPRRFRRENRLITAIVFPDLPAFQLLPDSGTCPTIRSALLSCGDVMPSHRAATIRTSSHFVIFYTEFAAPGRPARKDEKQKIATGSQFRKRTLHRQFPSRGHVVKNRRHSEQPVRSSCGCGAICLSRARPP